MRQLASGCCSSVVHQFCKVAVAHGVVQMDWEEDDEEYSLSVPADEEGRG